MKLVSLLLSTAFLSQSALGLSCKSSDGKYLLEVESIPCGRPATLFIDGKKPQFGDMECDKTSPAGETVCYSKNVADAGYSAVIRSGVVGYTADLSELWIGGTRPLASLLCDTPLVLPGCGPSVTTSAVVRDFNGLDGCGHVLEVAGVNGPIHLEPTNLPAEYQQEGAKVIVSYNPAPDMASICMVGDIVDITSIKPE